MENNSGLEPLGRAVLVKYYEVPERRGGVILIPDSVMERSMQLEQRALVVAVGKACWPDEPPRAAVGDKVLIAKMAGYPAKGTKDGEQYRLVNDRDIFARVIEESSNE
jgi:co-chaperonin GroES (HSP10)